MTITDNELGVKCINILMDAVGPVETERFVYILNSNQFDYTEWQRDLFKGETVRSLGEKMMAFNPSHQSRQLQA